MNKQFLVLLIFVLGSIPVISQTTEQVDSMNNPQMVVGKVSREMIQQGDFGNHFINEYATYQPDSETNNQLKNKIYNVSIVIVMATWCSDSQMQVPRFYKILDQLDYNTNQIDLICVDRQKTGGSADISSLEVDFVPTFIFYRNGDEIGRIIESPEISLEKDALLILSK